MAAREQVSLEYQCCMDCGRGEVRVVVYRYDEPKDGEVLTLNRNRQDKCVCGCSMVKAWQQNPGWALVAWEERAR